MDDVKPDVQKWHDEIKRGVESRKKHARAADWGTWEDYYHGRHPNATLTMNYAYALIRGTIPRVYFRNPSVTVTARSPERTAHARVAQHLSNYLVKAMGLKATLKRGVLDTSLYGIGVYKLGYDSEFGFRPQDLIQNELGAGETLAGRDGQMRKIEYNANVRSGMPWALRCSPHDILVDPACTDPQLRDARWVAHRVRRRRIDAEKDERWNVKGVSSTHVDVDYTDPNKPRDYMHNESANPESDWIEAWEITDRREERVLVVSTDHGKFIRNDPDSLLADGLNYVATVFNHRENTCWGISDMESLHQQQVELNTIRMRQKQLVAFSLIRFLVKKGAMAPEQMEKLMKGDPMAWLEVNDGESLSEIISQLNVQFPAELSGWGEQIQMDMRELHGMGRNQIGEYNRRGDRTATEASIVQQNTEIRTDERRDVMSDAVVEIIEKSLQMCYRYWNKPQVARVVGPDGMYYWVEYTGSEIRGDYDFVVEADEALPVNRAQRKQEALLLFDRLAQLPPEIVQHSELVRTLFRNFDGIDPDTVLRPAPQQGLMPMGQYAQMWEQQPPQGQVPPELMQQLMAQAQQAQGEPPQSPDMMAGAPMMGGM